MIIVTGGAGFIGSALIWKLNQLGEEDIIIVDDLSIPEADNFRFGQDNDKWKNLVSLKYADVFDKEDFGHMISSGFLKNFKIDTLFHLGACSSTTEKSFNYLFKNNFEYTKYLCEQSLENDVRFIYASSAATYGDGANGYIDDESKLHTLKPLNAYGFSKHMFDLWAKKSRVLDRIVGLKYFNVYGPNEYHKEGMQSVVNKCFHQIKETGKARLFSSNNPEFKDGEQRRDFLYVKDAVDMTLFFMENKIVNGIYNIGTGEANTFNDFVKPIFNTLNVKENIEYFEMPDILKEKYQYFTEADISKLRSVGFDKKLTPINEAVSDYVKNYLNSSKPFLGEK
ncbi:MAG TPA: ADP-glyceromanno-heptose 6-epimerase [Ignavibacteria bacterium]|nr:ADP-glyceromanno-heptose 6-epimerase [Ignavibacteria bacterium]